MTDFCPAPNDNRITLTEIRIINWSRFQDETIHLNGSALITGVNGTGKSTVLDALTYALFGNQRFNKAADDKDRSVLSYVRGDTKSTKSASRFLRTGPVVSYIALQWRNEQTGKTLVTAVCVESPDESHHSSSWFIEDDAAISDFNFSVPVMGESKKAITPLNQLQYKGHKYTGPFYSPEKAKEQVLRTLGLRCDIKDYRQKMMKVIAFKPESNINNFIQQCVLDPKPIDSLKNILEHKEKTERMKEELNRCEAERSLLSKILSFIERYETLSSKHIVYELMLAYQNTLVRKEEKRSISAEIGSLKAQLAAMQGAEKSLDDRLDAAQRVLIEAEKSESFSDLRPLIDEKEKALAQLEASLAEDEAMLQKLTALHGALNGSLAWVFDVLPTHGLQSKMQLMLNEEEDMSDIVSPAFAEMCAGIPSIEEELRSQKMELQHKMQELDAQISQMSKRIRTLESNQPSIPDEVYMCIAALRRAFTSRGKNIVIRTFAELVAGIKDESWRNAIEAYLGRHRYDIIVDPQYASEAVQIRKELKLNHCSIVYTNLLEKSDVVAGSAAELLDIPNASARLYANYLLNNIHLCDTLEEMEKYPRGSLMRDGTLARGYTSSSIRVDNINFCLGFEAISMELIRTKGELKEAQQQKHECEKQLLDLTNKLLSIGSVQWKSASYRFDALANIRKERQDIIVQTAEIDGLKNNPDFLVAAQAQEKAKEALERVKKEHDEFIEKRAALRQKVAQKEEQYNETDQLISKAEAVYRATANGYQMFVEDMLKEYESLKAQRDGSIVVISESTLSSILREMEGIKDALKEAQMQYGHMTNTDNAKYGVEYIAHYRALYSEIQNVRIEHAITELTKAKNSLRELVVNDFLSEMATIIDGAKAEMANINRELKQLPFGRDIYQFEMTPRKDRAAFFRQCRRLDEAPMFMDDQYGDSDTQEELDAFIDQMVSDILDDGGDQDEYADYRRYFTYSMKVTSREGDEDITFDLATKYGSSSGGEKETPNLIILAASLMQCYPRSVCCERMMFIDESFSNLSAERIHQLVKYLEDNRFQVIYAAPPEKLSTIGALVPNTIGLISSGRYTHVKDFSVS